MKLHKFALLFATSLLFAMFVLAQDDVNNTDTNNNQNPKETRKVSEIGKTSECDLGNSLQNVRDGELGADPTAKLYIIIYDDKDRLPSEYDSKRLEQGIREQFAFLGMDENRIVIISGGFRDKLIAEVWIVPEGGNLPEPTNTVPKSKTPKNKTYLYDRTAIYNSDYYEDFVSDSFKLKQDEENRLIEEQFALEHPEIAEEMRQEEISDDMENQESSENSEEYEEYKTEPQFWVSSKFGEVLKNQKSSTGVMIFYADEEYFDILKVQTEIENGRQKIVNESKISSNKIKIVFGGYRDDITIEFWVVPNKGKPPIPAPTERPTDTLPEPEKPVQ
jgi:hypothetical protein